MTDKPIVVIPTRCEECGGDNGGKPLRLYEMVNQDGTRRITDNYFCDKCNVYPTFICDGCKKYWNTDYLHPGKLGKQFCVDCWEVERERERKERFEIKDYKPSELAVLPPIIYSTDGITAPTRITVLFGPPASFKSFEALEIGRAVATGTPAFRAFETKKGRVSYIDLENGLQLAGERIRGLKLDAGESENSMRFIFDRSLRLDAKEGVDKIRNYLTSHQTDLLILDSARRYFSGREADSEVVALFMGNCKNIAEEFNTAVLILHHSRKMAKGEDEISSIDEIRGSSDWSASADIVLTSQKLEGDMTAQLRCLKNRLGGKEDVLCTVCLETDDFGAVTSVASTKKSEYLNPKLVELVEFLVKRNEVDLSSKDFVKIAKERFRFPERTSYRYLDHLREVGVVYQGNDGKQSVNLLVAQNLLPRQQFGSAIAKPGDGLTATAAPKGEAAVAVRNKPPYKGGVHSVAVTGTWAENPKSTAMAVKTVKVLEDLAVFVGSTGKRVGPLFKGAIVTLSSEDSNLLIEVGKAELIERPEETEEKSNNSIQWVDENQ